jgi:hypothetical protein
MAAPSNHANDPQPGDLAKGARLLRRNFGSPIAWKANGADDLTPAGSER